MSDDPTADFAHTLVVVEPKHGPPLAWAGLRRSTVVHRGYLSLVVVDGPDAHWVVPPVPEATSIPASVTIPKGTATASAGIGDSIAALVFDASALIPSIRTTDVQLYTGALVEAELHPILSGEIGIDVRVSEDGILRPSSGRAVAAARPARAPATRPAQPTASPTASPTSLKPTPTVTSSEPLMLGRRILASIFAAFTLPVGVNLGVVGSSIWGRSPHDLAPIVRTLVDRQSAVFGVSVILSFLVIFFGPRFRGLALLGLADGLLVGVAPAALFFHVDAPPFVVAAYRGIAQGSGQALGVLLIANAIVGLLIYLIVRGITPPRPKTSGHPSRVDQWVFGIFVALALTGVVPWLLGRYVLEDNIVFNRGYGVFDTSAREFWPYFVPLYLGGIAMLLIPVVLILIFQPWWRRGRPVIVALVAGLAIIPIAFGASDLWRSAEAHTVVRLSTTAYPFGTSCGSVKMHLTDPAGGDALYQVWTSRTSTAAKDGCDLVQLYRGWKLINTIELPAGTWVVGAPTLTGGPAAVDAKFGFVRSDKQTIETPLSP